jgi:hypothetical protein
MVDNPHEETGEERHARIMRQSFVSVMLSSELAARSREAAARSRELLRKTKAVAESPNGLHPPPK